MNFHPLSIIIIGIIFIPNVLCIFFPPVNIPKENSRPVWWKIVILLEWIGRIGVMTLPFLYELKINGKEKIVLLFCMLVCAIVYYMGWYKYLTQGREYLLLFQPLGIIPVPMAIFPILYFIFAGLLLSSWPIVLVSIIFGIGHISESLQNFNHEMIE
jgi:hypothetical protein